MYRGRDGWISLGVQTGKERHLDFTDVPDNALMLLSNLTRGKQECLFICRDGRQEFW